MKARLLIPLVAVIAVAIAAVLLLRDDSPPTNGIPVAENSNGNAETVATTTNSAPDAQAYVDCMRDHDVAISDPDPETGLPQFDDSVDTNSAAVQSALEDCQSLMPSGLRGDAGDQDLDSYLAFSDCMRDNGFPDFPDPQPGPDGMFAGADIDRTNPSFQKAAEACGDVLTTTTGDQS